MARPIWYSRSFSIRLVALISVICCALLGARLPAVARGASVGTALGGNSAMSSVQISWVLLFVVRIDSADRSR
eukprot:11175300-Lingulodinium_polyedra.AAC.1